jgi:predicted lipid-binding transport protein (Tim44 family)
MCVRGRRSSRERRHPRRGRREVFGRRRFADHVASLRGTRRARRANARGFASAGAPRDDRDAIAEAETGATKSDVDATNAVDANSAPEKTDPSTPAAAKNKKAADDAASSESTAPRVPLDGTSSTETDGVHAKKVVQNTWWEALTMTPVYAFRATRAKWASAPAVKAAIDPGFDADAFSRLAAAGRDEVLRAYAANDMRRVRVMCTPEVFDAFQQSRIEYERNNLNLRYDRDAETAADDDADADVDGSAMCVARLIDLRLARQEEPSGSPVDPRMTRCGSRAATGAARS